MFSNSDSHLSEFQDGGVSVLGQVALALLWGCRGSSGLQASLPAVLRLLSPFCVSVFPTEDAELESRPSQISATQHPRMSFCCLYDLDPVCVLGAEHQEGTTSVVHNIYIQYTIKLY